MNFTLIKALYASLFELLAEQINKSLLVGKRRAGWSISFPPHPRSGRRGLQRLCSGRYRLHSCTIFVTCSGRLISGRQEWLFKENEIQNVEALNQHDDDAKKSHVGGSRGLSLAANNDEVGVLGAGVIDLTSNGN